MARSAQCYPMMHTGIQKSLKPPLPTAVTRFRLRQALCRTDRDRGSFFQSLSARCIGSACTCTHTHCTAISTHIACICPPLLHTRLPLPHKHPHLTSLQTSLPRQRESIFRKAVGVFIILCCLASWVCCIFRDRMRQCYTKWVQPRCHVLRRPLGEISVSVCGDIHLRSRCGELDSSSHFPEKIVNLSIFVMHYTCKSMYL